MAYSKFNLEGKVALITGGNNGIGLGMAEALAEAGSAVCIWGRTEEKNRAAEEKLKQYGGRVLALRCDVSDEQQVEESFAETVETLGRVDSCFANAAVGQKGTSFHKMDLNEWREVIGVNLEGVFFTFRAAIRHMLERGGGGSLVGTSSLAAIMGQSRGEHYAAAKAGVLAIVRTIAAEYARHGIRANAIVPGFVESGLTHELLKSEAYNKKVLPRIPQRRWGVPEDFGGMAVYFASDAGAYHSGDTVIIDGGFIRF